MPSKTKTAELREAFHAGAAWQCYQPPGVFDVQRADAAACEAYPTPTRPRVLYDVHGAAWRYLPSEVPGERGRVQWDVNTPHGHWRNMDTVPVEVAPVVADLMATPTEPDE